MEKNTRAELIAALVTDKHSGFKDGDQQMLEACGDARLEEFRTASEANRATASTITRMETDQRNTQARLTVAEGRLAKAEQTISDEDFIARLSLTSPIRALLESRAAEEAALKASLVSSLKNIGGETEDDLKKKPIADLQVLARYAGVKVHDFSGRGLPTNRSAESQVSFAPPDPFKADLEKLRAADAARR